MKANHLSASRTGQFQRQTLTGSAGTPHPACGQPNLGVAILPSAEKASDEILTKEGLAEKMKVSVATIENWTRREHLPVIQKLNVVRFYWPDVLAHIRTHFKPCPRGTVRPPLSK